MHRDETRTAKTTPGQGCWSRLSQPASPVTIQAPFTHGHLIIKSSSTHGEFQEEKSVACEQTSWSKFLELGRCDRSTATGVLAWTRKKRGEDEHVRNGVIPARLLDGVARFGGATCDTFHASELYRAGRNDFWQPLPGLWRGTVDVYLTECIH